MQLAYFLLYKLLQFIIVEQLVLHTIFVVNNEIYQFLDLKSAVYNRERLQIKNGL